MSHQVVPDSHRPPLLDSIRGPVGGSVKLTTGRFEPRASPILDESYATSLYTEDVKEFYVSYLHTVLLALKVS